MSAPPIEQVFATMSNVAVPTSYNEALNSSERDDWKRAIELELKNMEDLKVWVIADLPLGKKCIGCKWVFAIKCDSVGNVERYKARLVAQGFTQRANIDYDQVFSPVARYDTIRVVLAIANSLGLQDRHFDIKCAFLNGKLQEEIYMKPPQGLNIDSGKVVKLLKSIYGLKQAGRVWNSLFNQVLIEFGYKRCDADACLYVKMNDQNLAILVLIVDDILAVGQPAELDSLANALKSKFAITDKGQATWFLGMKIERDFKEKKMFLSQTTYIEALLAQHKMENCRPVSVPATSVTFDSGAQNQSSDGTKSDEQLACEIQVSEVDANTEELLAVFQDYNNFEENGNADGSLVFQFRSITGGLMYLCNTTRPELTCAVSNLARYMAAPKTEHLIAAKRVLRYLKGTINLKLTFNAGVGLQQLHGFADADYAGCKITRKSNTGFVFYVLGAAVAWKRRLQPTVALSSMEAEYMAASDASKEAIWLRRMLTELYQDIHVAGATIIYEDNQSCIAYANNPVYIS